MLRSSFRPWGSLCWVLEHLPKRQWGFIGCLGTEERCLAVHGTLRVRNELGQVSMLKIVDDGNGIESQYADETANCLSKRETVFVSQGGRPDQIEEHGLLERDELIVMVANGYGTQLGESIVLDISSFPKRFFFVLVKVLFQDSGVKNLIVTYTVPAKYDEEFPLAEDPMPRRYLHSMFMSHDPEPSDGLHIVGVGYEPLGLQEAIAGKKFELLFPFPSPAPGVQRNWEFVRELVPDGKTQPNIVNTYDVSEVFDRIKSLANDGERHVILSPYGPKTMSLAMCLYASSEVVKKMPPSVFYTQPTVYNPNYSSGIATEHGIEKIFAYCLKLNGRNLY